MPGVLRNDSISPYKAEESLKVLRENLIPMKDDRRWHPDRCFVGRSGPISPMVAIDMWELQGMARVERVLKDLSDRSDPRYLTSRSTLESAVLQEEVEFMDIKPGRLETFYS